MDADREPLPALWYLMSGGRQERREMVRLLAASGIDATPRQVMAHFNRHRGPQPAPYGLLQRDRAHGDVRRLEPRLRAILDLVWRMRSVATSLVVSLYYEDEEGTPNERRQRAEADLRRLAQANFLHRFYPPEQLEGHPRRDVLWFLGRDAVPWLEARYGTAITTQYFVTSERQIGTLLLNHDMGVNRLMDVMRIHGREEGALTADGHRVTLDMPPANWYGARHLAMGFGDRLSGVRRTLISDGFAAVNVRSTEPREGFPPAWVCPFLFEFDRGGRPVDDVVAQMLSYHSLALEGAGGRRFPQLDVAGYTIPVVMVFRLKTRVKRLGERVRARAAERGITRGAPIFLVRQDELEEGGWNAPTVSYLWDPDPTRRWPLYRLLEQLSLPLIRSGRVGPRVPLLVDADGAQRVPISRPPRRAAKQITAGDRASGASPSDQDGGSPS